MKNVKNQRAAIRFHHDMNLFGRVPWLPRLCYKIKIEMWAYAQYNPNKGQGDLIKSNSPTSAHQLAPAPLRHAQDLTVMRQATQLIPRPPPPTNMGGVSTKPNSTDSRSSTLTWPPPPPRQWVLAKAMSKQVTLAYLLVASRSLRTKITSTFWLWCFLKQHCFKWHDWWRKKMELCQIYARSKTRKHQKFYWLKPKVFISKKCLTL